ncbi:hypothetical protein FIBSPDRAFT_948469 [Athelia psychrophila]|uniref:Uncharacterized protein n=1 Tax=Athelia psychrophila TaxID=1759441 RepID=A0A166QU56_9AGAM|nr:hypothetical protein FIBSPDRAFT_948469 [Fibularhizoctonia sp. CBS 109695]
MLWGLALKHGLFGGPLPPARPLGKRSIQTVAPLPPARPRRKPIIQTVPPLANLGVKSNQLFINRSLQSFVRPRRKPSIQTVDHSRLRPSDYLNLAGLRNCTILTQNSNFRLTYSAIGPDPIPFPPSARGFLYLFAPSEEPQITWQIRFRVTDNDSPESFKSGSDLLSPSQTPWFISLVALKSHHDSLFALRELLVHDGLEMEYLASKSTAGHGPISQPMIYSLGQVFHIEFVRPELRLGAGHGEGSGQECKITSPFCIRTRLKQDDYLATTHHPYAGSALCCFGAHSSPTSTQPNTLALRIMKIITPVSTIEPEFTYRTPMPQEGELAMRYTRTQKGVGTGLARTLDPQPWTLTTGIRAHPIVQAILRGKTVPWTVR